MKKTKKIVLGAVATAVPVAAVGMMAESINLNKELHENANQVRQINKRAAKQDIPEFTLGLYHEMKPPKFYNSADGEAFFAINIGNGNNKVKFTRKIFDKLEFKVYTDKEGRGNPENLEKNIHFEYLNVLNGAVKITGLSQGHMGGHNAADNDQKNRDNYFYLFKVKPKKTHNWGNTMPSYIQKPFQTNPVKTIGINKSTYSQLKPSFKIGKNITDKDEAVLPNYKKMYNTNKKIQQVQGYYKIDKKMSSFKKFDPNDHINIDQETKIFIQYIPVGDFKWKPDASKAPIDSAFKSPKWTKTELIKPQIAFVNLINTYSSTSNDGEISYKLTNFDNGKETILIEEELSKNKWGAIVDGKKSGTTKIINLAAGKKYRITIKVTDPSHYMWKTNPSSDPVLVKAVQPNTKIEIDKPGNLAITTEKPKTHLAKGMIHLPDYVSSKFEAYYTVGSSQTPIPFSSKEDKSVDPGEYKIYYKIKDPSNYVWKKSIASNSGNRPTVPESIAAKLVSTVRVKAFTKTELIQPTVSLINEKNAYSKDSNDAKIKVSTKNFKATMAQKLYEVTSNGDVEVIGKKVIFVRDRTTGAIKSIEGLKSNQKYKLVTSIKNDKDFKWKTGSDISTTITTKKITLEEIEPPKQSEIFIKVTKQLTSSTDEVEVDLPKIPNKGIIGEYFRENKQHKFNPTGTPFTPSEHIKLKQGEKIKISYRLKSGFVWKKDSLTKTFTNKNSVSKILHVAKFNLLGIKKPTVNMSNLKTASTNTAKNGVVKLDIPNFDVNAMKITILGNVGAKINYNKQNIPTEVVGLQADKELIIKIELNDKTVYKWENNLKGPFEYKFTTAKQTIIGIDRPTNAQLQLVSQVRPTKFGVNITKVVMPTYTQNSGMIWEYTSDGGKTKHVFRSGEVLDITSGKRIIVFVSPDTSHIWNAPFNRIPVMSTPTKVLEFIQSELSTPTISKIHESASSYKTISDGKTDLVISNFDKNLMSISIKANKEAKIIWDSNKKKPIGIKDLQQDKEVKIEVTINDKNQNIFKNKKQSVIYTFKTIKSQKIGVKPPTKSEMITKNMFNGLNGQNEKVSGTAPRFSKYIIDHFDITYKTTGKNEQKMISNGVMKDMDQDSKLIISIKPKKNSNFIWVKGTKDPSTKSDISFGIGEYVYTTDTPKYHKNTLVRPTITLANAKDSSTVLSKDAEVTLTIPNFDKFSMWLKIFETDKSGNKTKAVPDDQIEFKNGINPVKVSGLDKNEKYIVEITIKDDAHNKWKTTGPVKIENAITTNDVNIQEVSEHEMHTMYQGSYDTILSSTTEPMNATLPDYDETKLQGFYNIHDGTGFHEFKKGLNKHIVIGANLMNNGKTIVFKYKPKSGFVWHQDKYKISDGRSSEKETNPEKLPAYHKPIEKQVEIFDIIQIKKASKGKHDAEFTFKIRHFEPSVEHIYLSEMDVSTSEKNDGITAPQINDSRPKISILPPEPNQSRIVQKFRIRKMTSNRKFKLAVFVNDIDQDSFSPKDNPKLRIKTLITTPKEKDNSLTGKQIAIISLASVSLAAGTAAAASLYKIKKVGR